MSSGVWWRVWLGCGITCQALLAQGNANDDTDKHARIAHVIVVPALRGDLSVTIYTYNMTGVALDAIRQAGLPCDWRPKETQEQFLDGVCRKYLQSDGASARGALALAPLVTALRKAGAGSVRVSLNDYGRPLAEAPKGWTAEPQSPKTPFGTLKSVTYRFVSLSDSQLPRPCEIRIGNAWSSSRLVLPFAFTLCAPALLALWLRSRAERTGATETAPVWVHWILTGTWLYWISSVSVTDIAAFAVHLQLDSMVLTFLIGSAVFAAPPLIAMAGCIAILMRAPAEVEEQDGARGLVKRSVLREAALMIPFGMFLVGLGMFDQDWQVSIASLPAAYFAYRVLSWCVMRWSSGRIEILTRGELMESASTIARSAGVTLGGIYIIGSRVAQEANAFASSGKVLAMTRSLVERLTRRELNAVIGHEVGHLRGKHVGIQLMAFCGYVFVIGPLAASFVVRAHLPQWLLSLPILPFGYILGTAFLSRKHEFSADVRAAELTGDPEAVIAGLARLRKMTRTPVDWGGIQGSILSHPSMRNRVLALARRFGVAEDRALALLNDPDLLAADTPPDALHYPLPPECAGPDLLFTSSAKAGYAMWSRWAGYLALAGVTLAAGHVALRVWPRYVLLALLISLPIVGRLYLTFLNWQDRCFMKYLHRRLRRRMGPAAEGGAFVGLLPGDGLAPLEGFYLWDAGFLSLVPDRLTYHGERAGFSLPRSAIAMISVEKGPLAWDRPYAAMVAGDWGSFALTRPDRGASRRQARRLVLRLNAWWRGEPVENVSAGMPAPLPGPELPVARPDYLCGWRAVRVHAMRAVILSLGLVILMPYQFVRWTPAVAFVPFMAPLAYLVAVCPTFFRAKPAAANVAEAASAAQRT